MIKILAIVAALALLLLVGGFLGGLTGNSPGLLMLGVMCAGPVFFMSFGAVLGRASNEFRLNVQRLNRPAPPVSHGVTVNSRLNRARELQQQ